MTHDARSWVPWIIAAALLTTVARNPLYTLILLLVSRIMLAAFADQADGLRLPLWRIGVLIVVFSAAYNALFVHVGETILVELPEWPMIGGPITAEALVTGAVNGFLLVAMISVFMVLSGVVPVGELVRLTPGSLRDLAIVVLIAITYVPETLRHLKRIREAQAIRGHELRGLRDWQPVVLPLLIGGLERAMRLAESMVARGFGATKSDRRSPMARLALTAGLLMSLVGWLLALWRGWPGWLLIACGVFILASVIWRSGRRVQRTSYRQANWQLTDTLLVLVAAVACVVILLPWPFIDRSTLSYSAFPLLRPPQFDWKIVVTLMALAAPAAAALRS